MLSADGKLYIMGSNRQELFGPGPDAVLTPRHVPAPNGHAVVVAAWGRQHIGFIAGTVCREGARVFHEGWWGLLCSAPGVQWCGLVNICKSG